MKGATGQRTVRRRNMMSSKTYTLWGFTATRFSDWGLRGDEAGGSGMPQLPTSISPEELKDCGRSHLPVAAADASGLSP